MVRKNNKHFSYFIIVFDQEIKRKGKYFSQYILLVYKRIHVRHTIVVFQGAKRSD